jgi:hypothetical protein
MTSVTFGFARDGQRRAPASTASSSTSNTNNRLGLGFNSQLSNVGVDTLSVRYWADDRVGFEGMLGFSLGDNNKYFDLGGKFLFSLKKEQNLNLYGFGLLGIENANRNPVTGEDKSDTALTVAGGLGAEFFLPGLPNLGFSTELGLGYNSTSKIFDTFGHWIPNAGIHYYF